MRRVLQQVVSGVGSAFLDVSDFLADLDKRLAEAIKLRFALALCRLDHECLVHRPGHRRGVESIVHEPLRNILHRHPTLLLKTATVYYTLMPWPPMLSTEHNPVVRF